MTDNQNNAGLALLAAMRKDREQKTPDIVEQEKAEDNVCSRTGLPHSYWPQGNCQYCGKISPVVKSLRSRAEKAEAGRQQSSREWRKAFDAMHQRTMKAEATCEKLAGALLAAQEVVNVAEQMTSSRSDDEWIWGVQAKIKDALSANIARRRPNESK